MKSIIVSNGSQQFTFHDNQSGTILREFEGFEFPTTRPVIEDIPARGGALYIGSQFGRRRLSWSGDLVSDTVYNLRRQLLAPMEVGALKTLKFTTYDDLELQTQIEIQRILMPYTHMVHTYLVEAIAPDYRFYSQAEYSENTVITEAQGGMAIKAPIPAPIGGGSSVDFILANSGTIATLPVFTIRGPGTDFIVQNTTTGKRFDLDLTLGSAETVTINTQRRTAFKGNQNVFGSFSGDWMELATGNNRIVFNAVSGFSSNTRLTVTWRDAYIGI